jgi:hypothetical protein
MFKANIRLTREINSTSCTVNVEGELTAPLDQPEEILKQLKSLFKLAEDALTQKIEDTQRESAQRQRYEEPFHPDGNGEAHERAVQTPEQSQSREEKKGQPHFASEKQLRYLQSLSKRHGLSRARLEDRIAETLGKRVTITQLTKREAGQMIDSLTQNAAR